MDKIIDCDNFEDLRKKLKKEKNEKLVRAKDFIFNRKLLESGGFDVLVFPSVFPSRKSLKKIDCGFNYYTARLAKEKEISVGLDLSIFRGLTKNEKSSKMEEMISVLERCKKARVFVRIIGYKDKLNAFDLANSLGIPTNLVKIF